MKKIRLAYLAGMIDADGCISISKRKWKDCRNVSHFCELTVTNTDQRLMDWLKTEFGGSVTCTKSKNPRHKDRYNWRVSQRNAKLLLKEVAPFMVIKKEQAELAIQLENTKQEATNRISEELIIYRENIKIKIGILNRRGPIPVR